MCIRFNTYLHMSINQLIQSSRIVVFAQKLVITNGVEIWIKSLTNLIFMGTSDFAIFLKRILAFVSWNEIVVNLLIFFIDVLLTNPAIVPNPMIAILDSIATNAKKNCVIKVASSLLGENVKLVPKTLMAVIKHNTAGNTTGRKHKLIWETKTCNCWYDWNIKGVFSSDRHALKKLNSV